MNVKAIKMFSAWNKPNIWVYKNHGNIKFPVPNILAISVMGADVDAYSVS